MPYDARRARQRAVDYFTINLIAACAYWISARCQYDSEPTLAVLQFGKFDGVAEHRAVLSRHKGHALDSPRLSSDAEITVRIVGTEEGQQLNREYRKKDYATNVLTFDYTQEPVVTADLVLCAPVVAREAVEQNKSLEEHYAHLLVHGTLHAQGGTMKPVRKTRTRWSLTKPPSCKSWGLRTRTPSNPKNSRPKEEARKRPATHRAKGGG